MPVQDIRNIAIIAHVDHGKTTLVDALVRQSGNFREGTLGEGLVLDNNPLERERGITILSKNISVRYRDTKINIIDTPGHADFGGEVERVLKMADGVLLVVDAYEGPMPQTRFVLKKAFQHHLRPIVVINKIDRPEARLNDTLNEVFDLFVELGADDLALDFLTIYASGRAGYAMTSPDGERKDMQPLFEAILKHIPAPKDPVDAVTQMLVLNIDYSDYVGRIGIGRVFAGKIRKGQSVAAIDRNGAKRSGRVVDLLVFEGLGRAKTEEVTAGDLCCVVGFDDISIGETLTDPADPRPLPGIAVDEPTLSMTFQANDSPYSGREGKFVTSRQVRERLEKELRSNLALRVDFGTSDNVFNVSGRGLLHLGILVENMRREGFELAVGKPRVIFREIDGKRQEPVELLTVDVPSHMVSNVMALLGDRRAEMVKMDTKGTLTHLEFKIPARGLIGLKNRMLNATQGEAVMYHTFEGYQPVKGSIPGRKNGMMIAKLTGKATRYAIERLMDRGTFFVKAGDEVYEGMCVGENCKDDDIIINITEEKRLTNMRVSSAEATVVLREPRTFEHVEEALEYIEEDELVEFTPTSIRIRKRLLNENDRKRESRTKRVED
jgi:GTP-binding protein